MARSLPFVAILAAALLAPLAACGGEKKATWHGTVTRLESGAPIPNVEVSYVLDGTTKTTKSDSSGTFAVSVPEGSAAKSVEVIVALPGFGELRRTVALDPASRELGKFAVERAKTPAPAR